MPSLKISLLGDLRILREGNTLASFPTHQTRCLLAYLLTFRKRAHTRDELAGVFWGDYPESRAHRNLNTTLWRLRRVLPDGFLRVEGDTITVDPACEYWLDTAQFEADCAGPWPSLADRIAALERAISLYRGDFLQGWYEDWVLVEAERLRLMYSQALQDIGECYQASGQPEKALDAARMLLGIDPLKEDIHRQVMGLYASLGRREAALSQFETCKHVLYDELGIAPSKETTWLAEKIRAGQWEGRSPIKKALEPVGALLPEPVAPTRSRTPFDDFGRTGLVGRSAELSLIRDCLAQLQKGRGGLVLVEGEAGVGKTRLADEAEQAAEIMGIPVLRGVCQYFQTPPPYNGLSNIVETAASLVRLIVPPPLSSFWLSELTLLIEANGKTAPAPRESSRLIEAIARLIASLTASGPHVIILDDLHWADPATLESLVFLAPRLGDLSVLLLLLFRPEELTESQELAKSIETLRAMEIARPLRLDRLSADETVSLVCQTLGLAEDSPALARFVYRETEGNPFFVSEILKSLVEDNYLRLQPSGKWDSPWDWEEREVMSLRPPQGIRQAIQRRLDCLPADSRMVLDAAAVLNREFSVELLQQVSGLGEQETLTATDDLLRRQLLIEVGDQLRFCHDKVRQVAYQVLSARQRRNCHARAGDALIQMTPSSADEMAGHYFLAQDYARALPHCLEAGQRARALYANRSALTYIGWAVDCARQVGGETGGRALLVAYEQRGQIWEHLSSDENAMSDYKAMQAVAERLCDRAALARAVRHAGWLQGNRSGEWERGLEIARQALSLAQDAGDEPEMAWASLDIGANYNMLGDYTHALEYLQSSFSKFKALKNVQGEASALQYLAVTYHFLSRFDQALTAYEQSYERWLVIGNQRAAAKIQANIGYLTLSTGRMADAHAAFSRAETTFREIETPSGLVWVLIGIGALHRYCCRSRDCLATFEEVVKIDPSSLSSKYHQSLIANHAGMAYWHLGETELALSNLEESLAQARLSKTPSLAAGVLKELGHCLRQLGQVERAIEMHRESLNLSQEASYSVAEVNARGELGLDLIVSGEIQAGLAMLMEVQECVNDYSDWHIAAARVNLGEGYLLTGDAAQALPLLREGAEICDRLGVAETGEWAYLQLGRCLAALGQAADAVSAFQRGLSWVDPSGNSLTKTLLTEALQAM